MNWTKGNLRTIAVWTHADLSPAQGNRVKKAGGKLIERGEHSEDCPYAYVADPDGYIIEL